MRFILVFLVGGGIIGLSQIVKDLFKLKVGQVTVIFVMTGAFLEFFDIYDKILEVGGAGAILPITNFGHSLAHSSYVGAINEGLFGLLGNVFDKTTIGIVFTILLGVLFAYIFKSKK